MADEKWRNFPMIGGSIFSKYEVSSLGRTRNKGTMYISVIKPKSSGYVCNDFYNDKGISKTVSVHNIVARAFLGEPKSASLTVDHINRERADNRVVNLRWATKKQQTVNSDKSKCKTIGQPVIQHTMDMEEIKRWPNIITAAKELGIHNGSIGMVCRGRKNHAGGYKWVYERQDLEGEVWKEYEPLNVQVSNMGRIKPPHNHIIYGSKNGNYLMYGKPGKGVHIMIAEIFLDNPGKKPQVNHKDKNGFNNKLENLEWATPREQLIHSHQNNSNPNRYSTAKAVKQYDLEGMFIDEYRSNKNAAMKTGCSRTNIYYICLGLLESTKGFVFKYSDEDLINRPAVKCPKKIDFFIEDGNIIDVYDSVKDASLDLGISYKSIYNILSGTTEKTRDGYRFRYH